MPKRVTYIKKEVLESFPCIDAKTIKETVDAEGVKSYSDYTLLSVIKLLFPLSRESLCFSDLRLRSEIRMKKSFLNYLRFCNERRLISKAEKPVHGKVHYSITEKGTNFLRLFL